MITLLSNLPISNLPSTSIPSTSDSSLLVLVIILFLKAIYDIIKEFTKKRSSNGVTNGELTELEKRIMAQFMELKSEVMRIRDFYHQMSNMVQSLTGKSEVSNFRIGQLEEWRKEVDRDRMDKHK